MVKIFTPLLFGLMCVVFSVAASPDSAATITSSKETYQFVYNAKANRVEVQKVVNNNYVSNGFDGNIPIAELYNDEVTFNNVTCKVDNRHPKDFKPEFANYSVGDVFYSDSRICYFPMVLPKKGSKGEVAFDETIIDPRYFTSVWFSEPLPVLTKDVTFIVPRWMKLELKEYNFGNYAIRKSSVYDAKLDADVTTYTAKNLPSDKTEPNSPGPTYLYPHVMVLCKSAAVSGHNFTYFGSLDDQYGWYRQLVKGLNNNNDVIAAKARELTAGLSADMDKIKAVFYYVQDNIRYIAFEDGMAGFKPENADEVLRKKYGDCKGMANLTKSLLTALGYDARLCWLGTDHIAYDYQTPSMAVDNHMICALNYKGKMLYLDATESYLGLNEYAERIQGRQVMVENGDKFLLNRIPVATATQNADDETGKLTIDGASLKGNVNRLWKGEDKEAVLSGLNNTKKERTDEAMTDYLSNSNGDYEIKELKLSSTTNPDKDLTAAYNVNFKNAVSVFSKTYYVDLDFKKELMNSAIKVDERKHDFWFDYRTDISKEIELTLPPNYKVATVPTALDIINPDYEFHIQYRNQPGKLIYKKSILIKNTHLATSKFAQWNRDIEQLAKTYNETVTLKPTNE